MNLTSSVFDSGAPIPQKYGMDFENINPPLSIRDVPGNAVSLVLTMDDPDVPDAAGVPVWDHWIVFNIPPDMAEIPENWNVTGVSGSGTRGEQRYMGPRPPDREHRYFFKLYALDTLLNLPEGSSKQDILDHIKDHILASCELMGTFAPST